MERTVAVRKVEQEIERLSLLRTAPESEATTALAKALTDRVNLVVAKAAKIAGERRLSALVPKLLRAFDRLFENDPQCWGKNAIAQALVDLEYRESAPYVRGAQHIQMEPVWGGQQDTATTLRGICVLALASGTDLPREDTLRLLVDALVDAADPVRVEAVRALAQMGGAEGALLLRLKARMGDKELPVVGQTFDSLLAIERESAIAFVAGFLKGADEGIRAEAALSLGSSRLPAAVTALRAAWDENKDPDLRLAVLRGLAVSRQPEALDFLLDLVKEGRARDACAAIEALSVDRDSDAIRESVEGAADGREPEIQEALRAAFANSRR
jgi:HEAT repeat protein